VVSHHAHVTPSLAVLVGAFLLPVLLWASLAFTISTIPQPPGKASRVQVLAFVAFSLTFLPAFLALRFVIQKVNHPLPFLCIATVESIAVPVFFYLQLWRKRHAGR
jgi:hypothetical protein